MSSNLDQLTADAMKLLLRDRVRLAQRLVSTIDDEVESDTEALWFAEAERRLEELRNGKVQGIPAEDVFRNVREVHKRCGAAKPRQIIGLPGPKQETLLEVISSMSLAR